MPSGKTAIMTNRHVCQESLDGYVFTANKMNTDRNRVKIIKISNESDLCLLESESNLNGLKLADTANIGDLVVTAGHPAGLPLMLSKGEIVGLIEEPIADTSMAANKNCNKQGLNPIKIIKNGNLIDVCMHYELTLLTTCEIVGGSSGSPLVNIYGNVVGVINASGENNWGYAVPLSLVERFIRDE